MNIKKLCLSLSVIALSGSALADDTTAKSTYDWTGVYVGGFIGGATGADVSNTATRYTYNDVGDGLWNAPGAENNDYSTKAGFIGGATVGYNWQIGKTPYVVGLEGEYGYLSQSANKLDPNAAIGNAANGWQDDNHNGTSIGKDYGYGVVGGRLGYALDRSLIYIKSGVVFTSVSHSMSETWAPYQETNKTTTTGYALGAGLEYALPFKYLTNVTVKTEYLYLGIPTSTTLTAVTNDPDSYSLTSNQTTSGIHTAKIGVNYKF